MKTYFFNPDGVCSRSMKITVDDGGIIASLEVLGGCNGNLQGISSLVSGLSVDEVISKLAGIKCREKKTSCPDQLTVALRAIKDGQLKEVE